MLANSCKPILTVIGINNSFRPWRFLRVRTLFRSRISLSYGILVSNDLLTFGCLSVLIRKLPGIECILLAFAKLSRLVGQMLATVIAVVSSSAPAEPGLFDRNGQNLSASPFCSGEVTE